MQRPRIVSVPPGVFLSTDRVEASLVWIEGVHAENTDSVFQEFRGHTCGEIWVKVGVGCCPRELNVPAGSNKEESCLPDRPCEFLPRIPPNAPTRTPEASSVPRQGADINHDSLPSPLQRDTLIFFPFL